jgi:hypothetical protein
VFVLVLLPQTLFLRFILLMSAPGSLLRDWCNGPVLLERNR